MPRINGHPVPRQNQELNRLLLEVLPRLRNYARSLTRDRGTAEDLVHDTVLRAMQNFHMFQPGTNFPAWVFRMQRNLFISGVRGRKPAVELGAPDIVGQPQMTTKPDISGEFRELIPLLGYLEREQLDCLLGAVVCDFNYEQLGEIFGVDVGTVKSRISRGRSMLRDLMRADVPPAEVDLSSWKDASARVATDDSYFSIAKAYEEVYAIWKGAVEGNSKELTASTADGSATDIADALADIRKAMKTEQLWDADLDDLT